MDWHFKRLYDHGLRSGSAGRYFVEECGALAEIAKLSSRREFNDEVIHVNETIFLFYVSLILAR